jgi:hypothetical protein
MCLVGLLGVGISIGGAACVAIVGDFPVSEVTGDASNAGDASGAQDSPSRNDSPSGSETSTSEGSSGCGAVNQACCANSQCNGGTCCNSVCVDTTSDGKHCGSCTRDCKGGACSASLCQPIVLTSLPNANGKPGDLAVDQTDAYWVQLAGNGSSIFKCSLNGCATPNTVAQQLTIPTGSGIALSQSDVFFNTSSGTSHCPKQGGCGGPPQVIYASANTLGLDGDPVGNLFVMDRASSRIMQLHPDGTGQLALATGLSSASTVALGPGGNVYYADTGAGIVGQAKIGLANSGVAIVQNVPGVFFVAGDSTNVYWASQAGGRIFTCPFATCDVSKITALASGQNTIGGSAFHSIVADPSNVYWTSNDGTTGAVRACPSAGCNGNPITLASHTGAPSATFEGIAQDPTFVYFTYADGPNSVLAKVAK